MQLRSLHKTEVAYWLTWTGLSIVNTYSIMKGLKKQESTSPKKWKWKDFRHFDYPEQKWFHIIWPSEEVTKHLRVLIWVRKISNKM